MNYTKAIVLWLILIILPTVVKSQYCNDTTCAGDEEYILNVTEHLWLNKIRTARQFSEDTSLKTLIVFHQRFMLKKNYKFLNSLECLNCIVASKKMYKLDTNIIKVPNLRQVHLTLRYTKKFPLFILTAKDLKSVGLSLKDESELHQLQKYSLEHLFVYFNKYLTDSLHTFIYRQKELISLNFIIDNKTIYLSDSILNLKNLENLTLPIDLDERNLDILSKLNLKKLGVNSVKLHDISKIQQRLPSLDRLWINESITLNEGAKLRNANPNVEIRARVVLY